LGPREVDLSGPSWIEKLFRMKDRDRSGTLDFREFKAILRRYGKVGPKTLTDQDLVEVFKLVDTDADNQIDPDDFEQFLLAPPSELLVNWQKSQGGGTRGGGVDVQMQVRAIGRQGRDKLWSTYDWNTNGKLSNAEIDKGFRCHPPQGWVGLDNKKALLLAFKAADKDWSGYVTRKEFNKLLKYVVFFHMLWDRFDELDSDGDHRLDFGEFSRCCRELNIGDVDGKYTQAIYRCFRLMGLF
jgi:Ca2+-binding EF-hand superfamily protein